MPRKVAKAKQPRVRLGKKQAAAGGDESEEETPKNDSREVTRKSKTKTSDEGRKGNAHYDILQDLAPIIESSQNKSNDVNDLLQRAMDVYEKSEKKVFSVVLWRMMIIPFDVKEKFETIERTVSFFFTLVTEIIKKEGVNLPENPERSLDDSSLTSDQFSHHILRLCEKYHDDYRPHVRMRIAQTIVRVCEACQSMDQIDSRLKRKISNVLLLRLKDKYAPARCEAAKGLCYFQGGQGCPITSIMMEFIRMDPRPEVRRALVLSIVLDSDDYGDFLDRVTDVHPEVRRACMRQIREISLESIPMEEREKIVSCGLTDTSVTVRTEAVKLVKHWFKVCGEDPFELLNAFDVYNYSQLCARILNVIFEEANDENWVILDGNLREEKFIPLDSISEAKFFMWWYLFERFSSKPYYADKLFPTIAEMSSYCKQLIVKLETECFDDEERSKMMSFFLKIVLFIPIEEGGRVELDKMARSIFKFSYKTIYHMKDLVMMMHKAHPNGCDEILLEIIRDMLEFSNSRMQVGDRFPQQNREDEIRELKLKVSTVLHKKYKLQKEKEEHIKLNDFLRAHAIQEQIKGVEEELVVARQELHDLENAENIQALDVEEQSPEQPHYSAESLNFAFSAFFVHLKLIPKLSQYVRNFFRAEVVGAIFREEPELRIQVLQIVTQVGYLSLDDASTAMIMCLQAVLNETGDLKNMALQGIFDLVLQHGLSSFESPQIRAVFAENVDVADESETVEKLLIHLLTSFFKASDDALTVHVAIVGMLKLLIMGRLKASKIVATLLAFWANSANEGSKLYHDIGAGLSVYVQQSSEKAETVARALVPSISKVINAPMSSTLKAVDPEKLMGFITMQTDQTKLSSISRPHMPHQIIAVDVLEEIRKRPLSPENNVFVKALKGLNLRGISTETLVQLKSLLKYGIKEGLRTIRMSLTAFGKYLDELNPEVRALAQMSDPGTDTYSSSNEAEDNDRTDMFVTTIMSKSQLNRTNKDRTLQSVRSGRNITAVSSDSDEDDDTVKGDEVIEDDALSSSGSDFQSVTVRKDKSVL